MIVYAHTPSVVYVYTPPSGKPKAEPRPGAVDPPNARSITPVAHGVCCAVGVATTVGLAALFYPELISAVDRLHVLSTTALVFLLLWVWIGVWAAAEMTWGWRTARLSGDR